MGVCSEGVLSGSRDNAMIEKLFFLYLGCGPTAVLGGEAAVLRGWGAGHLCSWLRGGYSEL